MKKKKSISCNTCEETPVVHPDHSLQINRLNRMIGQLEGIKKMIERRSYCPDILIQTKAVRSALRSLETNILEKHIEHCVRIAFASKDKNNVQAKIDELTEIFSKMGGQ